MEDDAPVLGASDTRIQRGLRRYGKFIARHTTKVFVSSVLFSLAIIVGGIATRIGPNGKAFMNPLSQELQWSVSGGKLEKGIKIYHERKGVDNPWSSSDHITMFVKKDDDQADVAIKGAFLEMLELYNKTSRMSVEVAGLTYTWFDLCNRGILPDIGPGFMPHLPFGAPEMPCSIISPITCFKEAGEMNSASYRMIDPIVTSLIPSQKSFSTRPSIHDQTDDQIKTILSEPLNPDQPLTGRPDTNLGCYGDSIHEAYYLETFGGGMEFDGFKLKKARGFRSMLGLDAVARIQYRMAIQKSAEYSKIENIKEAKKKMDKLYHKMAYDYGEETKYVEIANLDPDFNEALAESMSATPMQYLLGGFALNFFYCCAALVSYRHPAASRAHVGLSGLCFIILSAVMSFCAYLLCGFYLNGPMMIGLPCLALGIGLDDMFVVIRYFSNLGSATINLDTSEEIIGETLASAGLGTTFTSVCNVLAFSCGIFLPVPAMADFCMCAMFVALCNYFTNVHMLLPMLANEVGRIQRCAPDPHPLTYCCHRRVLAEAQITSRPSVKATTAEEYTWSIEKVVINWLRNKYAPALVRLPVAILVTIIGLGTLGLSIYFIQIKEVGWAPKELVPKDNYVYRAFELVFSTFSVFGGTLFFDDIDVPGNQKEMLQLLEAVTNTDHITTGPPAYLTLFYLTYLSGVMQQMQAVAGPNVTVSATDTVMALYGPVGLDMSWTHSSFAPYGTYTTDPEIWYPLFNGWRALPDPEVAWLPENMGFMYADIVGVNGFVYKEESPLKEILFSSIPILQVNLKTEGTFIDMIDQGNKAIEASPLKDNAYMYGPITTFWEVFIELEGKLFILLAADMGIIFVVSLVFFEFDVLTALITAGSCCMIVFEVYGISCVLMNFNVFVAAISLMSMGMSVEFTAHLAAAFSTGEGDAATRLGTAMAHTFPALLEGIISTFCGIVPLGFHPALFTVKYLFGIFMLVIAVGAINGLIIMPGMLAMLSPCFKVCKRGKDVAIEDSPPEKEAPPKEEPWSGNGGYTGNTDIASDGNDLFIGNDFRQLGGPVACNL